MKKLIEIGFVKIGGWKLENNKLQYYLGSNSTKKNILYSFVCNEEVKYIGKTVKSISQRLYGYKKPSISQRTNYRVNKKIIELLKSGLEIDIYIFIDNAQLKYRNYTINLSAGLEDTLISKVNPQWNFTGKKPKNTQKTKKMNSNSELAIYKDRISFVVIIGKAYYYDGFFNVRVKYTDLFGKDLSKIRIQLGDDPNNICPDAYVNRTANTNCTPRIMAGKKYRNWIKKNFKQGDVFYVSVIEFNFIILSKTSSNNAYTA